MANGNPKYIFWNDSEPISAALRKTNRMLVAVMKKAGLCIRGNVSHRFRDTAVDDWLGAGVSLTDISNLLGDTLSVVEQHYRKLASRRVEARLESLPRLGRWQTTRTSFSPRRVAWQRYPGAST
jgi:hypothetical protein